MKRILHTLALLLALTIAVSCMPAAALAETKLSITRTSTLNTYYGITENGQVIRFSDNAVISENAVSLNLESGNLMILLSDVHCVNEQLYYAKKYPANQFHDLVKVTLGMPHMLGLKSDGRVVAYGENIFNCNNVSSWRDIVDIAAGRCYSVGLRADGTVVAIGENDENQLNVKSWRNIVAIDAEYKLTVGLTADGHVVYAGKPNPSDRYSIVHSWSDIVSISTDGFSICAVDKYGKLHVAPEQKNNYPHEKPIFAVFSSSLVQYADGTVGDCWIDSETGERKYGERHGIKLAYPRRGYKINGQSVEVEDLFPEYFGGAPVVQQETSNFVSLSPSLAVGEQVLLGKYEQDGNAANGPEDIRWNVLDIQDGKAYLLSDVALEAISWGHPSDTHLNDESNLSLTWENSYLNSWLNETFTASAFTQEERSAIQSVTLLSIKEADRYLGSASGMACKASKALLPKLSLDRGARNSQGYCNWWLRDMTCKATRMDPFNFMSTQYNCAAFVDTTKGIRRNNQNIMVHVKDLVCVRPAMWVALQQEEAAEPTPAPTVAAAAPSDGEIRFQGIMWGSDIYTVLDALRASGFPMNSKPTASITNNQNALTSWNPGGDGYRVINSGVRIYATVNDFKKSDKRIAGYPLSSCTVYCAYDTTGNVINTEYKKTKFYMGVLTFQVMNYELAYDDLSKKLSSLYGEPVTGSRTGFYFGTNSGDSYTEFSTWYGENNTGVTLVYEYDINTNATERTSQSITLYYGKTDSTDYLKGIESIRKQAEMEAERREIEQHENDTSGL